MENQNIDRRKVLGGLAGLATVPFLGNKAHADYNETEVGTFLKMLADDVADFNKTGYKDYTMRLTEGKFKGLEEPHLWLNVTYNPLGPFGGSHGKFFLGEKSNNISMIQLADDCMIVLPNDNIGIEFDHKGKNHGGRYLLFGNPRVANTSYGGGVITTPGSMEMKIGNEKIDIDYMKSNSKSDLSRIYKQLI
jgi:hypothetical protein